MKRLFDIAISLLALALATPLLAVVAVLVRLEGPGDFLFKQVRVGRDRKPFVVLKIRTMLHRSHPPVSQFDEPILTDSSDSRITRIGRLLRATSLDELPQLWNVLWGDMSLVGPRPILPEQLDAIPVEFERRFAVRPGITGLAQVRGRRSLSWLDQLAADCEYADKAGLMQDLAILARTVVVVVLARGVYPGKAQNWRQYLQEQRGQPGESGD